VNERATILGLAYRGRTASIGFAHGPFVRVDGATSSGRVAAAPPDEAAALRAALVSAGQQIAKLAEAVGGDAAQILEFQVALLEDDDFLDPVFAAIAEATPAHTAWSSALEEQIADYNAAADEYLQGGATHAHDRAFLCRGRPGHAVAEWLGAGGRFAPWINFPLRSGLASMTRSKGFNISTR